MSTVSRDVRLRILAETKEYIKALKELPGTTEKQAAAAGRKFAAEITKAEVKAATAAVSAAEKASEAWGTVGSTASKFAQALGVVSPELAAVAAGIADLADGAEGLDTAAKASGLSMTALGVAGAAVLAAVGAVALIYADMSREIELAADVTRTYQAANDSLIPSLRELEDVQIDLAVATGDLTDLEGEATRARVEARRSVLDLAAAQREQRAALRQTQDDTQFWVDMVDTYSMVTGPLMAHVVRWGADEVFGFSEKIAAAEEQLQILDAAVGQEAATQKELRDATIEAAEAAEQEKTTAKGAADAERARAEALREAEQAARQAADATRSLEEITDAATASQLSGAAAIDFALSQQMEKIDELIEKGGDLAAADAARAAATAQAQHEQTELFLSELEKEMNAAETALEEVGKQIGERFAQIQQTRAEITNALQGAISDVAGAISDVIDEGLSQQLSAVSSTQEALRALGEEATAAERQALLAQLEAEQDAALRLFRASKTGAISQALINGALAVTTALAQLGPVAGGIAAAGIAATTSAQIGIIAAQPPPEFHRGGTVTAPAPWERDIRAQGGESVLTTQGTRAAGGPAAVETLNRGAGGTTPIWIPLQVGARTADLIYMEATSTPGRARQATRSQRPRGRRSHYAERS